mmetsp:Transcript_54540/g.137692  ORF Transcript_54540/g.137692 Transcript_54540/m.137692 type:complete len:291 (+) Transcript_54540:893-1765(+)
MLHPVLERGPLEQVAVWCLHRIMHERAAELALRHAGNEGLIGLTKVALPIVCRDQRRHVVVLGVILIILPVTSDAWSSTSPALALRLHAEHSFPLACLVLRSSPIVLATGLPLICSGAARLLASRRCQCEGEHLASLRRRPCKRQSLALLGCQPPLQSISALLGQGVEGALQMNEEHISVRALCEINVDGNFDEQLNHRDVRQAVGNITNSGQHIAVAQLWPEDVNVEGDHCESLKHRLEVLPFDVRGAASRIVIECGEDVVHIRNHDVLHDGALRGQVLPELFLILRAI